MTLKIIVNVALFQAGWFACVLGAAQGRPLLGVAVVAAVALAHLTMIRWRWTEVVLLAAVAFIGAIADSVQMQLGFISFPAADPTSVVVPLWFPALWLNFATTLNVSLRWLGQRWLLAAAFGAVGGPLAYGGGAAMGAIALHANPSLSLAAIAFEWALLTPLLVGLAGWLRRPGAITDPPAMTAAAAGGDSETSGVLR